MKVEYGPWEWKEGFDSIKQLDDLVAQNREKKRSNVGEDNINHSRYRKIISLITSNPYQGSDYVLTNQSKEST